MRPERCLSLRFSLCFCPLSVRVSLLGRLLLVVVRLARHAESAAGLLAIHQWETRVARERDLLVGLLDLRVVLLRCPSRDPMGKRVRARFEQALLTSQLFPSSNPWSTVAGLGQIVSGLPVLSPYAHRQPTSARGNVSIHFEFLESAPALLLVLLMKLYMTDKWSERLRLLLASYSSQPFLPWSLGASFSASLSSPYIPSH
ncbi:hypothetical protein GGS23DRAFT_567755 [Durotheca rogersii]|uniref:uncharacterized protein n=1 Tax=Durotheca rogersii TaxID=419775 RepID=UPI0022201A6E|nr:uncharacterized protein GGS23DRAFT_567755 [Durotheca rogersii]KAI5863005.1 hypothetical protein GGS23DRAFT_567755 [Durotheca rogersii]